MKQGGSIANNTGKSLEDFIESKFHAVGYSLVPSKKFFVEELRGVPIFTKQFPLCANIYGTQLNCDFIAFHPQKFPNNLVIESKWQQSNGSVDEKFPFLVANIREKYPCEAIILLDGGGYKVGAEKWLRAQVDRKLLGVFTMSEFQKWVNQGNL